MSVRKRQPKPVSLGGKPDLDARTFQKPLDELADTIALKVQREGPKYPVRPIFAIPDIYYLLRQSQRTYDLFFFINADERRHKDVDYRLAYSVVILPVIRTMIDCLYNITVILKNPGPKGYQFRESGLKLMLEGLDADEQRYGGDQKWHAWIAKRRREIDSEMQRTGLTEAEVRKARTWPTLSAYLRHRKNVAPTRHQEFLKRLTFGFWQEYSGISHATFQGLLPIAVLLAPKDFLPEHEPNIAAQAETLLGLHLPRVAAILLCTLTEIHAHFRFDGARINQRLHDVWNALLVVPEIKELHDERYAQLMHDRGINP